MNEGTETMAGQSEASIEIKPMSMEYLDGVMEVETASFSIPWSRESFVKELTNNKLSIYVVAVTEDERVVGYGGMWHVVTEGHITNVAVAEDIRGRGVGRQIMSALESIALEKEMIGLTLEVRMGNTAAMGLYSGFGFKIEGIRKNYYADTKEDAVIMWKYL